MAALNGQEAAETEILTIPATTMQVEGNPKRTGVVGGKVVALYSGSAALSARVEPRLAAVGVSVWGYGQEALGEWPRLLMSVNGEPVGDVVLGSSEENEYYVPIWADPRMPMTVQIRFVNDYYNPAKNEDRNAFIRQLTITTQAHR